MDIRPFLVSPEVSILKVVEIIDANRKGVALVVNEENRLVGVVTDGDVRRAILAGIDLKKPTTVLLKRRSPFYSVPVVGNPNMSKTEKLSLMQTHKVRHLPIIDAKGIISDLILLDDWLENKTPRLTAVVMAGGLGQRLRPLTDEIPKPMLPVNGKPMLEHLIEQLRESGIHRVHVTTHYKPECIVNHFGDGDKYGVQINYVQEAQPLGTAGGLQLLETSKEPLLVINGDILTRVDFSALFDFHTEHQAVMTVAVREYSMKVPYGVVSLEGVSVKGVEEKPCVSSFVNAGIYIINPSATRYIPQSGHRFDMTDLISALLIDKQRVVGFPVHEYWLDIGKIEEYQRAKEDVENGRF
jgi:dTDP-glucose pyrophosphorylase